MSDIIAVGGAGFLTDPANLALEKYIVDQARKDSPRVLMIATARGDDARYVAKFHEAFGCLGAVTSHLPFFERTPDLRSLLLSQDVIYVGGGNTKSMLGVWREWGLTEILEEAHEPGDRAGRAKRGRDLLVSAGRDRFMGGPIAAAGLYRDAAGQLLPPLRWRIGAQACISCAIERGEIAPGYTIDDGVAVHFRDRRLERVVVSGRGRVRIS